jgi:hypothetical protein
MKKTITFKRVANGEFESFADGVRTPWKIHNVSGHGRNIYGITKDGETVKWFGPLRTCKMAIEHTLNKAAAAQAPAEISVRVGL